MTWSSRPTISIFRCTRPEKDFKTALNRIMLNWSSWKRSKWICKRQWTPTNKTLKKSKLTLKKTRTKVTNRNTKSSIRKKRKSTNSLRNLKLKKLSTRKKSETAKTSSLSCWSICKRQWPDKTNFHPKLKWKIWRVTLDSNKINLKIVKLQLLDSESNKNQSRMISKKWRILKAESKKKWSKPKIRSKAWTTIFIINSREQTNCRHNLSKRSSEWRKLKNSWRSTRLVCPSR